MQSKHINPFLQSATTVIEQLCAVRPSRGAIKLQRLQITADLIWLKITIYGQLTGDILFSFPEPVALKIASGMMGGVQITEFDMISQSAISELGNMISGNASTLLYNEGIEIDITPPIFISDSETQFATHQALAIPLHLEGIGEFEMQIVAL